MVCANIYVVCIEWEGESFDGELFLLRILFNAGNAVFLLAELREIGPL